MQIFVCKLIERCRVIFRADYLKKIFLIKLTIKKFLFMFKLFVFNNAKKIDKFSKKFLHEKFKKCDDLG